MTVQADLCRTWSEPKLLVFSRTGSYEPWHENRIFAYAKTKAQISFAVRSNCEADADQRLCFHYMNSTISHFLSPKFKAFGLFQRLYRPVYVGPGRKPLRPVFSVFLILAALLSKILKRPDTFGLYSSRCGLEALHVGLR